MRITSVCLFLIGTLLQSEALVGGSPYQITVLLQFEAAPSNTSISALNSELRKILFSSNSAVHLNLRTEPLNGVVDGDLIIFKMRGSCTMDALPVAALSDERGPLAMTHIVDGEILPFAEVECDRVRQSVQRTWGRDNPRMHEIQYGAALARVMAHEMYHMLTRSTIHQSSGVTKSALSSQELSTGTIRLSRPARAALEARSEKEVPSIQR